MGAFGEMLIRNFGGDLDHYNGNYKKEVIEKVLVIGQAPPLVKQEYPYDTTQLYDWLLEVGISKDKAQDFFEFEAMTDKLPKTDSNGHKPPGQKEQRDYYNRVLKEKIEKSKKIILLGRTSMKFFKKDEFFKRYDNKGYKVLTLIHPSKRNITLYRNNKEKIINLLKDFIYE